MTVDTIVDERTLREIYFASFENAVKKHGLGWLCVHITSSTVNIVRRTDIF